MHFGYNIYVSGFIFKQSEIDLLFTLRKGDFMREKITINTDWMFTKENIEPFDPNKVKFKKVNIPHTWNAKDGQDGGLDYYRNVCWYKKIIRPHARPNEIIYLEFEGVNSICDVYLNNVFIGHHEGGFSTFRFRIDHLLKDVNTLLVRVDNSENKRVYPQFADFTFFGGIYRDVNIIKTSQTHFDLDYYGGPGFKITPVLRNNNAEITVEAFITNHQNEELRVSILDKDDNEVYSKFCKNNVHKFILKDPHIWNGREDPYLYTCKLQLIKDNHVLDNVETKFGIREFKVDPNKGFILNGKPYPLRGVSRHQDRLNKGWAINYDDMREDMALIRELGANTIRLAHYQHNQFFYELCDHYGMIVWAEIPYISNDLEDGHKNAMQQMKELIVQNYNHPSIICWGISNEISIGGVNDEMIKKHRELNDLCHELDKTRATTMAHVSMLEDTSPLVGLSDICSYNHYFGWYGGELKDNEEWLDSFHKKHPNISLGLSEYGCEGLINWHSSNPTCGDYSEEYQWMYHYHMLEVFKTRPYLWATHVWNMFDFASDGRDEGGSKGRNNKGLMTYDRKTKKDSFYLYQMYWRKDPLVHLASKRYIYRNEETTKIYVFSNQPIVRLTVNHKFFKELKGDKVFEFEVPLKKGRNKIMAEAGEQSDIMLRTDVMVIKRTNKPHEEYSLDQSGKVVNWFSDTGEELVMKFDSDYFSIKDKIKDIQANPEGKIYMDKLIEEMLVKAKDIGFNVPKGALKMIGSFNFERIGKMLGDKLPATFIYEINEQLQKIKK